MGDVPQSVFWSRSSTIFYLNCVGTYFPCVYASIAHGGNLHFTASFVCLRVILTRNIYPACMSSHPTFGLPVVEVQWCPMPLWYFRTRPRAAKSKLRGKISCKRRVTMTAPSWQRPMTIFLNFKRQFRLRKLCCIAELPKTTYGPWVVRHCTPRPVPPATGPSVASDPRPWATYASVQDLGQGDVECQSCAGRILNVVPNGARILSFAPPPPTCTSLLPHSAIRFPRTVVRGRVQVCFDTDDNFWLGRAIGDWVLLCIC